jgi:hypothetical protein
LLIRNEPQLEQVKKIEQSEIEQSKIEQVRRDRTSQEDRISQEYRTIRNRTSQEEGLAPAVSGIRQAGASPSS